MEKNTCAIRSPSDTAPCTYSHVHTHHMRTKALRARRTSARHTRHIESEPDTATTITNTRTRIATGPRCCLSEMSESGKSQQDNLEVLTREELAGRISMARTVAQTAPASSPTSDQSTCVGCTRCSSARDAGLAPPRAWRRKALSARRVGPSPWRSAALSLSLSLIGRCFCPCMAHQQPPRA
eukprot:scaffold6111_cov107-Isochrysis_galbana.AAC.5